MGGVIDFNFDTVSGAIACCSRATCAGLPSPAWAGRRRSRRSTIAETVKPDFDVTGWFGLLGPARMPDAIVTRLNEDVNRIVQAPEFRTRLVTLRHRPDGWHIRGVRRR